MKNRAKCRLCNSVIESFHKFDHVSCKCGEISIDGGNYDYLCAAKDWKNFIRVDDLDNEILVKVVEKDQENIENEEKQSDSQPLNRKEQLEMLDAMIKNIESLPQQAMTLPITHYDFYSFMLVISSILKT